MEDANVLKSRLAVALETIQQLKIQLKLTEELRQQLVNGRIVMDAENHIVLFKRSA